MTVTEKLLRVFRVDQQLQGLQGRLKAAERFHDEQTSQIRQVDQKRDGLTTQIKQIQAAAANHEGEMARLDARIASLREQMNSAKTNKEYKAFLTEVNTMKADRDRSEQSALEQMSKVDDLKKQLAELDGQRTDREKVQKVAAGDRDKRADEIKGRVAELQAERNRLATEVDAPSMKVYLELVRQKPDEPMAPIEEQDRKRHEYTCGSCQMSIPVETVSALVRGGSLKLCVSCGCILYIEKEAADAIFEAGTKKAAAREKSRQSS